MTMHIKVSARNTLNGKGGGGGGGGARVTFTIILDIFLRFQQN